MQQSGTLSNESSHRSPHGEAPMHDERRGHTHAVQFYEDDALLAVTVADFVANAARANRPTLIIASAAHRGAFAARIAPMHNACVEWIDAAEMLRSFMVDGLPNRERFMIGLSDAAARTLGDAPASAPLHAYGEMVDLLWRDGNASGAIALERLWNEFAATHELSLLCAYDLRNFADVSHTAHFEAICREHESVRPAERNAGDAELALVEVALLQQRAAALATEIRRRELLEAELRDALVREKAARVEAEAATRAKSEFLAVMSHELRTPLNAIEGYAELMELGVHGPVTDEQQLSLSRIRKSQRHLLGLINGVLNYTRVEAKAVHYDTAAVPLHEVVATCDALTAPQRHDKQLNFTAAPCDQRVVVSADREKLRQIVLNLLTNAIKFTEPGGSITVGCVQTAGSVALTVTDSGCGIPADQIDRIFDPFVQVDARLTRTQDGVGLGLAISRDLARGMGGELTVKSVFGRGSTFTLTLPTP